MILASGSPRRQHLLRELGLEFEVVLRPVEEPLPDGLDPVAAAEALARRKSAAYPDLAESHVVITADTIVALEGKLLTKPTDRAEAVAMLQALSGKENQVISAVALRYRGEIRVFHARSRVFFRPLSTAEIAFYIDTCAPYDKAGAYAVQEWIGMVGIERIEGDYYNIVGLPVARLWAELQDFVPGILKIGR
ncbi:MAG: Maf family nucleotide pyrophosphatase [Bacteroidota bacterium]